MSGLNVGVIGVMLCLAAIAAVALNNARRISERRRRSFNIAVVGAWLALESLLLMLNVVHGRGAALLGLVCLAGLVLILGGAQMSWRARWDEYAAGEDETYSDTPEVQFDGSKMPYDSLTF